MIFNDSMLFLHVPKTGGMALTKALLDVLPRPVVYTVPNPKDVAVPEGVTAVEGRRHATLRQASHFLGKRGLKLSDFKAIVAVVRNPYDLEVSRYAYLQNGHPWDAGHNQRLALTQTFERFALESNDHTQHSISDYFQLDGCIPSNMRVIHTEHLESELRTVLHELGAPLAGDALGYENASRHGETLRYYTPIAEEAVYKRYRWVFHAGFYTRWGADYVRGYSDRHGAAMPLIGRAYQVGDTSGLFPDRWIGKALEFQVCTAADITSLIVTGSGMDGQADLPVRIEVNDRVTTSVMEPGRRVQWKVAVSASKGSTLSIVIRPARTKHVENSADTRNLSMRLHSISFQ